MINFIVISAPSGTGKTTLCRELQKRRPDFEFSVSCTTRPQRTNEENGRDYHFISRPDFEQRIKTGDFAEYEEVHGSFYYGTLKSTLDAAIAQDRIFLLEVDVKGAMSIKKLYPERTLAIFVTPPTEEDLRRRLNRRGTDSPERIEKRLERIKEEMTYKALFDHHIVNDELSRATDELIAIINEHNEEVYHGS